MTEQVVIIGLLENRSSDDISVASVFRWPSFKPILSSLSFLMSFSLFHNTTRLPMSAIFLMPFSASYEGGKSRGFSTVPKNWMLRKCVVGQSLFLGQTIIKYREAEEDGKVKHLL